VRNLLSPARSNHRNHGSSPGSPSVAECTDCGSARAGNPILESSAQQRRNHVDGRTGYQGGNCHLSDSDHSDYRLRFHDCSRFWGVHQRGSVCLGGLCGRARGSNSTMVGGRNAPSIGHNIRCHFHAAGQVGFRLVSSRTKKAHYTTHSTATGSIPRSTPSLPAQRRST
jgi:hypothetical protein